MVEIRRRTCLFLLVLMLISLLNDTVISNANSFRKKYVIPVGVILDMETWVGKTVTSCLSMAISDFYARNQGYRTRITLHAKNSHGDPLRALSIALDLVENHNVQAIIGPESILETRFLAEFGEKARIPILSFAPTTSSISISHEYKFLAQIAQNHESTQVKGIVKFVESFKWKDVILIYEDNDDAKIIIPHLVDSLHEKNIRVSFKSAISSSVVDDQFLEEELHKLMTIRQAAIFVVHMSPTLASRLFSKVSKLGMMMEGYAWIVTDWTMNSFNSLDSEVVLDSMQGVVGFKPYIPASSELRNFTSRWIKNYRSVNPSEEVNGLDIFGVWAYDAMWMLAKAVEDVWMDKTLKARKRSEQGLRLEHIKASLSGMALLDQMRKIRFRGLSGDFHLQTGTQLFEIVNVIGRGERIVGFWKSEESESTFPSSLADSHHRKHIIWPGETLTAPKGWMMHMKGKKLQIGVPALAPSQEMVKVTYNVETNVTSVNGFVIDVFDAAIKALRYEVPYEFIPFHGSYNDLIDQVYLRTFDAAVGDLTITSNRSLYVDFTLPFTDLGVGIVAGVENDNKWIFLKPLGADLWLTIVAFLFLTGIVTWVIEHPINEEFQGSVAQQIGTVLWFSLSTLVSAQRERLQSHLSRFVVTVWVLIVLILTSSYTAIVSSLLTVQQIELASKGAIGYGDTPIVRGAILNTMNFNGSTLTPCLTPQDCKDVLSRGRKNGGVSALISEMPYVKLFKGKYSSDRDSALIETRSTTNGFGFVFQKGSPLVTDISTQIAKLREEGALIALENKWFQSDRSSSINQVDVATKPRVLGLDNFQGLFLISGVSLGSTLVIFLSYKVGEKIHVNDYISKTLSRGKMVAVPKLFSSRSTINGTQELNNCQSCTTNPCADCNC